MSVTCVCVCLCRCLCLFVSLCTYVPIALCRCVYVSICTCICMFGLFGCLCAALCLCVYILSVSLFVCPCASMYVCTCLWAEWSINRMCEKCRQGMVWSRIDPHSYCITLTLYCIARVQERATRRPPLVRQLWPSQQKRYSLQWVKFACYILYMG